VESRAELLANPKQLPDPQANRERPPVRPLTRGHACGLSDFRVGNIVVQVNRFPDSRRPAPRP